MTIPIRPGPFSFLAELGRAGGEAFAAHERDRERKLAEARQSAQNFLALRAAGLMKPQDFLNSQIQAVFDAAGYGHPSATPTPEEQLSAIKSRFLEPDRPAVAGIIPSLSGVSGTPFSFQGTGPSSVTDEQRIAAGLPLKSQVIGEKVTAAKGGRQLKTLTRGTEQQKDALSGVPDALTLQTQTEASRDQLYTSLAQRVVDAQITRAGGSISQAAATPGGLQKISDAAWEQAQQDAKSRGYVADEQITRPYIDAAIQARIREQARLDAASQARAAGQDSQYLRLLVQQQGQIADQIKNLNKPDQTTNLLATAYEKALASAKTPEERQKVETDPAFTFQRKAYDQVQSYNEMKQQLDAELEGLRNSLGSLLNNRVGEPGTVPHREAAKLSSATIDKIIQAISTGQATIADLKAKLDAGAISQSDYDAVESGLKRRAASGNTKFSGGGF